MFGFGKKAQQQKAIQQEINRAEADIMNGRDTRRGRALLGGKLTKGGYTDVRDVGRMESGADIRDPRIVRK